MFTNNELILLQQLRALEFKTDAGLFLQILLVRITRDIDPKSCLDAVNSLIGKGYLLLTPAKVVMLTEKGCLLLYDLQQLEEKKQMDFTLDEKKAARFKFLEKAYKISNGSESTMIDKWALGEQLGFPKELTKITWEYLCGEKLIKVRTVSGVFTLTHDGIVEIEEALGNPKKETQHFMPASIVNNINIGHVTNSNIQQGTSSSNQNLSSNTYTNLDSFLRSLEESMEQLKLDSGKTETLQVEIENLKALLKTSKPKKSYLKEGLTTIRNILEGIASSTIATKLLQQLNGISSLE